MEHKGFAATALASWSLEAGIVAGQMIQDVTHIVISLEYPHLPGDDLPAGENRIFDVVPESILVIWESGRFLIILFLFRHPCQRKLLQIIISSHDPLCIGR